MNSFCYNLYDVHFYIKKQNNTRSLNSTLTGQNISKMVKTSLTGQIVSYIQWYKGLTSLTILEDSMSLSLSLALFISLSFSLMQITMVFENVKLIALVVICITYIQMGRLYPKMHACKIFCLGNVSPQRDAIYMEKLF